MANKKKPLRRCMACNSQKEKQELLRIVRTPENNIEVDLTGKKNGRGAYICRDEKCLNMAIKTKRLEKVLEKSINQDFYEEIRGIIIGK